MIELKHLAPYLPYGLKAMDNKDEIFEMTGFSAEHGNSFKMIELMNVNESKYFGNFVGIRPILRPMSDLKKEITHKGKKLTPIYWLEEFYDTLDLHEQAVRLIKEPMWVNQCDYMLIIHLIEWYFDVFGLIEKGLAVDVNTLPQTEL